MHFDHKVALLEDETTYYVQVEVKVPKGAPANLTYERLSRLSDAFTDGLKL